MEKLYALVVVLSFVTLTVLVGLIVLEIKRMNEILMEILRTNSIKGRYPWDMGMEEAKRKAGYPAISLVLFGRFRASSLAILPKWTSPVKCSVVCEVPEVCTGPWQGRTYLVSDLSLKARALGMDSWFVYG